MKKTLIILFSVAFILGCKDTVVKCESCSCEASCCSSESCSTEGCSCVCKENGKSKD